MTAKDPFLRDVAQLLQVARPADSAERLTVRLRGMTSSTGEWHKVKVFRRVRRMRRLLGLPDGLGAGQVVEAWRKTGPPVTTPPHSMRRCPGCQTCTEKRAASRRRMAARGKVMRQGTSPPPRHGASGYRNYGCHCAVCCSADRAMRRASRIRAAVQSALVQPLRFCDLLASAPATATRAEVRGALRWLTLRGRVERRDGRYVLRPASPGL